MQTCPLDSCRDAMLDVRHRVKASILETAHTGNEGPGYAFTIARQTNECRRVPDFLAYHGALAQCGSESRNPARPSPRGEGRGEGSFRSSRPNAGTWPMLREYRMREALGVCMVIRMPPPSGMTTVPNRDSSTPDCGLVAVEIRLLCHARKIARPGRHAPEPDRVGNAGKCRGLIGYTLSRLVCTR
jgi:hypothetical protein